MGAGIEHDGRQIKAIPRRGGRLEPAGGEIVAQLGDHFRLGDVGGKILAGGVAVIGGDDELAPLPEPVHELPKLRRLQLRGVVIENGVRRFVAVDIIILKFVPNKDVARGRHAAIGKREVEDIRGKLRAGQAERAGGAIIFQRGARGNTERLGKRGGVRRHFRAGDVHVRGRDAARLRAAEQRGKIAKTQGIEHEDGATAGGGIRPPVHKASGGAPGKILVGRPQFPGALGEQPVGRHEGLMQGNGRGRGAGGTQQLGENLRPDFLGRARGQDGFSPVHGVGGVGGC